MFVWENRKELFILALPQCPFLGKGLLYEQHKSNMGYGQ